MRPRGRTRPPGAPPSFAVSGMARPAVAPYLRLVLSLALGLSAASAETITNPLGLDWPGELVHLTTNVTGPVSVRLGDELRPAQSDGSNVWFIATLQKPIDVTLTNIATPSPLTLRDGVVANGIYEYRLKPDCGSGLLPTTGRDQKVAPTTDSTSGLFRVAGDAAWYGQETPVTNLQTEVIARGPVFITVRQTAPGYERTLRFVAGDPWIDVTERYDLPAPTAHTLKLKDGLHPDTVFWVPWFLHGGFEPSGKMQTHPLRPQNKQGNRPFVTLSPRWNQQPGGGMDFFVTRNETNAPAVGIIATRPIRWFNPGAQAIQCFAENGDTARIRFPVHKGERSSAIVIGPRSSFDSQGKLDSLVRRHTDWTLDDQMHKYILDWSRDPAKAGPHILITRAELKQLQDDYVAGKETPALRAVREGAGKLKGTDLVLYHLITGKPAVSPSPPSAELWIGRRYQDDFLNPTSYTRRIKGGWPVADLLSDGKPIGGAWQAALGYIFTDLNHWPGWERGWHPGNPNFHTDKYMVAIFAAAAMPDHPHARQWMEFGKRNFDEDIGRVFSAPDGVGYECPGYSGYSLGLQLELARVFLNAGDGNLVAANPLWKKNAIWHRHLLTPFDRRLGLRHEAPIGDTHRWTSGGVNKFGVLAKYYAETDPAFAAELMGIRQLLRDQGQRGGFFEEVVEVPHQIAPLPVEKMDWGSHAFAGFGSVMRSRFGTSNETFVSFKAGAAHGHYHNDDLSYHFYGAGTPLSLDYNCSYHPRGDHAALHNSMTFGVAKPFLHSSDTNAVPAQEQLHGRAKMLAFRSTPAADIAVAERTGDHLQLAPIYPEQSRYAYGYPTRALPAPITHRRTLVLVKHPANSKLADYLVVRDATQTTEPQQLNIHLLVRDMKQDGQLFRATGQWDTDALVYVAGEMKDVTVGRWFYGGDEEKLIPPVGHTGLWNAGEYQKWLRIETAPGKPVLWALYPRKQGAPEPKITTLPDGLRVAVAGDADEIILTGKTAIIRQKGRETTLLDHEL